MVFAVAPVSDSDLNGTSGNDTILERKKITLEDPRSWGGGGQQEGARLSV